MTLLIMIGITLYIISGGFIKIILEILSGEKNTETDRIGMTIGYCERLLTIAFVMLNQYTALGLLVAAKSILRFSGDKSSESVRKESEYVLVGTMLSLVFGIVNGLIFMFALKI